MVRVRGADKCFSFIIFKVKRVPVGVPGGNKGICNVGLVSLRGRIQEPEDLIFFMINPHLSGHVPNGDDLA